MWEYFMYRSKLNKLYKNQDKIREYYKSKLTQDKIDKESLSGECSHQHHEIQNSIDLLKSERILRIAQRYDLPLPDLGDDKMWERGIYGRSLTNAGRFQLNKAIRQEKKERCEPIVTIITLLIGFGGVIIGILSSCGD
jgi:hypothetical protein